LHSSKMWLAGVALAFPLAASVGGGCAVFSGGNGGSGGSTSTNSSTSASTSSGIGGTGGVGTGGVGTGGVGTGGVGTGGIGTGGTGDAGMDAACACTASNECPASGTVCAVPDCTSCSCTTQNASAGTACTDHGGIKCSGAGTCVECLTTADCTSLAAPLCSMNRCVAATCVDTIKDGVETDVDCGGGGTMNCPPCALGKACLVNSDCASEVCTAHVCTAPPVNHNCAGAEPHTLTAGGPTLTISATTAGSTEDYTSFCGDTTSPPSSPNVVYALTLSTEGTFVVNIKANAGSTLLPAIDIRQDCSKVSEQCNSYGTSSVDFAADTAAGTYYIIVTGSPGTAGAFTLTAKLTAAACGDGVINAGEQCDPGVDAAANDGCGAPGTANACKLIPATAGEGDQCPGQAVPSATTQLPIGTTTLLETSGMSTYGFKDDYYGSCGGGKGAATDGGSANGVSNGAGGVDRVFQVIPASTGTLTASVGYQADGVTSSCADVFAPDCIGLLIYARSTCNSGSTELGCKENPATFGPATISFPVTAGTPYFIFVDGYDSGNYSYGPFNLSLNLK